MAELTYPQEIPWRLLTTSRDMMDADMEDRDFPVKWKSSMSVFFHEPELAPEVAGNRKIVYLKTVCSITGYQVDENELGVEVEKPKEWDTRVYNNFHQMIRDYYPCYGALLHFAVFPSERTRNLNKFPFIIDFEPKKREMFEVVTETGEVMSRSLHALKVNTGGTSTTSMETIDVDKGWSLKAEAKVDKVGGGLQLGSNYESGYKALTQGQNVNMRQIDASQEAKETLSHTTNLQQMYQLLDSYHLGTNRALFVVMPRPHIVDQELSVTNGPRRLEGIQEFFFVVAMPADAKGFCVVAQLETSHLHKQTSTETTGTTEYETGEITQTIRDSYKGGLFSNYTKRRYAIPVPGTYLVDRTRGNGGYTENVRSGDDVTEDIESHQVFVYDDRIEVEVVYDPGIPPDTAYFTADYTVFYRSHDPVSEPVTETITDIDLFMTGRHLQGCLTFGQPPKIFAGPPFALTDYVVMEETLPRRYLGMLEKTSKIRRKPELRENFLKEMNAFQRVIQDKTLASVNNPDRYPSGQHTILDTDFALRAISTAPGQAHNRLADHTTPIEVSEEILQKLDRKDRKDFQRFTRADLVNTRASLLARRTGLAVGEVIDLKKANLNIPATRR